MKKIIAVIRNEKVEETKSNLEKIGITGVTYLHVTGRGLRDGMASSRFPRSEYYPYTGRHPLMLRDDVPVSADPVLYLRKGARTRVPATKNACHCGK